MKFIDKLFIGIDHDRMTGMSVLGCLTNWMPFFIAVKNQIKLDLIVKPSCSLIYDNPHNVYGESLMVDTSGMVFCIYHLVVCLIL